MRILQVIAGLHKMGGTTTFVGGLANALVRQGHEVTIATYRARDPDDEYPLDPQVKVVAIAEVEDRPQRFDVVHVHGLWDRDVFWASGWALKHGLPLVWSPHGMLAPWSLKHRWWKKFLPWHLYLKRRLKRASAIHVTAELEKKWIEEMGLGPVVIAPLGTEESSKVREFESLKVREEESSKVRGEESSKVRGEESSKVREFEGSKVREEESSKVREFESSKVRKFEGSKVRGEESSKVRGFEGSKVREFRVLFVGRVHPVKGLVNLVKAVGKVREFESSKVREKESLKVRKFEGSKVREFESLKVRIVGPDDGKHLDELKSLCEQLHLSYEDLSIPSSTSHFNSSFLHSSPSTPNFDFSTTITFVGPKYGPDLSAEYDNCDVFVLPSFTENFGGVVVDALAHGKPVIASKFTPWRELEKSKLEVEVEGVEKAKVGVEVEERRLTSCQPSELTQFVALEPGDTFDQIEQYLRQRVSETFENKTLGIAASIGSKRNANELAKHMAAGESPEVHKFAAKNIGALFERGYSAVVHYDEKAIDETREKPQIIRMFSPLSFLNARYVATITLKIANPENRLYAVEALDIMRDECLEVHLAAEPRHFKTARLMVNKIAYYVGDVNRTHPAFLGRSEPFSIERAADLIRASLHHPQPQPSTSTLIFSRCGWWVSNDPETLAKTLCEAMSLSDDERRQMGEVGRQLVESKYTWSAVAKKMRECYESLKV